MLVLLDGHIGVEVGMMGREGMVGGHTLLGVPVSPWQAVVQGPGETLRLIGPRLASWLLMSHDRAQVNPFHVIHEFLPYMLGVRRVSITMAAGVLQQRGLIEYHRGELTVTDRTGLEAAACTCYAADTAVYAKWMR